MDQIQKQISETQAAGSTKEELERQIKVTKEFYFHIIYRKENVIGKERYARILYGRAL